MPLLMPLLLTSPVLRDEYFERYKQRTDRTDKWSYAKKCEFPAVSPHPYKAMQAGSPDNSAAHAWDAICHTNRSRMHEKYASSVLCNLCIIR